MTQRSKLLDRLVARRSTAPQGFDCGAVFDDGAFDDEELYRRSALTRIVTNGFA